VLREIELGHCLWGDDFQYVEATVLSRYSQKFRYRSESTNSVQLNPNPRYDLPQERVSTGADEDNRLWFCSKYQRNKYHLKTAHVVTTKGGKTRFPKHICATCWDTD
jgi:hypothetical protein